MHCRSARWLRRRIVLSTFTSNIRETTSFLRRMTYGAESDASLRNTVDHQLCMGQRRRCRLGRDSANYWIIRFESVLNGQRSNLFPRTRPISFRELRKRHIRFAQAIAPTKRHSPYLSGWVQRCCSLRLDSPTMITPKVYPRLPQKYL